MVYRKEAGSRMVVVVVIVIVIVRSCGWVFGGWVGAGKPA